MDKFFLHPLGYQILKLIILAIDQPKAFLEFSRSCKTFFKCCKELKKDKIKQFLVKEVSEYLSCSKLPNGDLHGIWKQWAMCIRDETPTKYLFHKMKYNFGKLDGIYKQWNTDGVLVQNVKYKDGIVVSKIEYDSKGKVINTINYLKERERLKQTEEKPSTTRYFLHNSSTNNCIHQKRIKVV